ncbi:MAG: PEP-CTERM sorting domain-containing protein [Verrucomicrobiota bacterium JB023]|nr:PEP-CTERM sorting domain-containing protein [Verrucomicrobiota bacterium JB023]
MKTRLATVVLTASLSLPLHAALTVGQTVGIDFGADAPTGTVIFNQFNTQTLDTESADFDGTLQSTEGLDLLGLGFSVTNNMGKDSGLTIVSGTSGPSPFDPASIYQDSYGAANVGNSSRPDFGRLPAGANLLFTFTGLDPLLTYDVTGGFDSDNVNFNTTWTSGGLTDTTDPAGGSGYVTLAGLSPDGSGTLEITVTKSTQLFVSGLTLTAVPEPSSAFLAGLGLMGLLARRSRR